VLQVGALEHLEGTQEVQPLAIPLAEMSEISLCTDDDLQPGQGTFSLSPLTNSSKITPQSSHLYS
jgi:hypothetical protein